MEIPFWAWSWLLTTWGVTGLWIAGRGPKINGWGWLVNLAAQVLWVAYAVATAQYGFIVSAAAYGTVFVMNFRRWWARRPKQFEVTTLTQNPWDPQGLRYTADGYVEPGRPEAKVGHEFEHEGIRFSIIEVGWPRADGRLRWRAADLDSLTRRDSYKNA